ncbi:MAG: B12-binding domain-containing radical SAM protein, partial [Planctomycetota bacterium]
MKLVENPKAKVVFYYPILWMPQWPLWPPLDLYVVASALMHAGYEVVIIDERVDPDPREWLRHEISDALFVGLTGKLGNQMGNSLDAARFVKSVRPDCPVVMGGWFPSLFPEQTMECDAIDVAVEGPGDFNIVPIADGLLEKKSLEGIVGVWSRENDEIVKTPFKGLPKLDDTAEIPWDVLKIKRYIHPHGWINYYSSRGCPGGCTFCAVYCLQPHGWTPLPADRVVNEIDHLVNRIGVKALKIVDTDFLASTKRILAICRQLLERKIKVRFEGLGRYSTMKKMTVEQIRLLRTAGCTEIEMGIESGAQRLCDMIQKNLAVDETLDLVRRFVDNGIRLKLNFMFGIPSETRQDLIKTFRLIHRIKKMGR